MTGISTPLHGKFIIIKNYEAGLSKKKYLVCIGRFRLSAHQLRIETGRHTKPVEKRLCLKCNSNNIQDEEHHLMLCEAFSEIRRPLLSLATQHITSFDGMSEQD